jgi:hypothetical protein
MHRGVCTADPVSIAENAAASGAAPGRPGVSRTTLPGGASDWHTNATLERIKMVGGEAMADTAEEIEDSDLDDNGVYVLPASDKDEGASTPSCRAT